MTLSTVAAFLPALASARRVAGPVRIATGLLPAITRANGVMCPGSCTTESAATAATSKPRSSGNANARDRNSGRPGVPNSDLVRSRRGVARRDTIRRDTAATVGSVAAADRAAKWRARCTGDRGGNDDGDNDGVANDDGVCNDGVGNDDGVCNDGVGNDDGVCNDGVGNDGVGNDDAVGNEGDALRVLALGATRRSAKAGTAV
jgi:hypothetical protein